VTQPIPTVSEFTPKVIVSCRDAGLVFPGDVTALTGVSFDLRPGELVSIVGPSGCGKSTLLRLIAGLLVPTTGRIDVSSSARPSPARQGASPARPQVGFVFQDATLLPWRTVHDNIQLPLELLRVSPVEWAPRIRQALELVGLQEFAHVFPAQLSGGMRMRVALVRALVTHPELLLLDEPFGALDEITRQRLNEDVLELWQKQKWSAIFITHNVFEAVFLSQRVIVMSSRPGQIIAEFQVPFDYPRPAELRGTNEYTRLAAEISLCLRRGAA
jgi:NitT/TauT family transport system ATP-binding protein